MPVQQELSPVTPVNKQINVYNRVDTSFPTSYLIALPLRPAAQTELISFMLDCLYAFLTGKFIFNIFIFKKEEWQNDERNDDRNDQYYK